MFNRRHRGPFLRDAPAEGAPGGPTDPPPAPVPPVPPAPTPPPAFDPSQLSPEARAYLDAKVREADTKARTGTRDAAAQAAEAKIKDDIAKLLGVKSADVDPAAVAAELAKARDENRAIKVESAVERAARVAGADEDLLVAKLARDGKLAGLDPAAADFGTKIKALVDEALAANPRLKLDATPATPPAGGRAPVAPVGAAPAGGERTGRPSMTAAIGAAMAAQQR